MANEPDNIQERDNESTKMNEKLNVDTSDPININALEATLLREIIRKGVGISEDSRKIFKYEILQEITERNRRNLLIVMAIAALVIGFLSFIGYENAKRVLSAQSEKIANEALVKAKSELDSIKETKDRIKNLERDTLTLLASLKGKEIETRREIVRIDQAVKEIKESAASLDGASFIGEVVFYRKGRPAGFQKGERVCALSTTYPWSTSRDVLRQYIGKKIYLSIPGIEHKLDFTVIGFAALYPEGRMIQIPIYTLEDLVGDKFARKFLMKGVFEGEITFPQK